jgi:tetratricopeptide (TPR) repeat protein
MWDKDTLAEEARGGKMTTIEVIVGAFDRNPPLYYQMRLDRVSKEIVSNPSQLDLYDDAGVAADRLGKSDEAIAWMAKKEMAMKVGNPSDDDRYKYHANLGTFYAHRWTNNGSDFKTIGDLNEGISHLKKAIEINPNAHFGREKFQVAILEWVKTKPVFDRIQFGDDAPLTTYLEVNHLLAPGESSAAIEGLSGIIRLGTGWESVDIFAALGQALAFDRNGATGEAAMARVDELQKTGKKSISGWVRDSNAYFEMGGDPTAKANARDEFKRLRVQADKRHENRLAFMLPKLKMGMHPDTDPNFWDGYREEKLEVRDLPFYSKSSFLMGASVVAVVGALLGIPALIAVAVVVVIKRRARPKTV